MRRWKAPHRAVATLLATFLLAMAWPAAAAVFPPRLKFRSLVGSRITVHFHDGLEPSARRVASMAASLLEAHEQRYGVRLPRVHIVLTDVSDDPNGFSSPQPYPLIQIRAAAPDGTDDFGNLESWFRLVLTHELAHSVHLEQARGLPALGRKIMGRNPYFFPNIFAITWMIEGLATYEETETTAFGRGRNPDSRMVLRAAALEDRYAKEDQAVYGLDAWPGGHASYLFGERFVRQTATKSGEDVLPRLAKAHADNIVPWLDERTFRQVTGKSAATLWREHTLSAREEFRVEAQRISSEGLTPSRALTRRGVRQVAPRFSPDGQWLAYSSFSLDHHTGLVRRNGESGLSWDPDGRSLVFDEVEYAGPFATCSDLRRVDLATRRVSKLTRGLRARSPDVSPDGKTIVFVRRFSDHSDLWLVDADGTAPRPLTASREQTVFADPRFDRSGQRVAASRWLPGGFLDIVLVDVGTGEVRTITKDRARDVEPTWTPDGSAVIFRSDRDGVSNLYRYVDSTGELERLTNVVGGLSMPSVSPDGETLAFASYSARGYDIHLASMSDLVPRVTPPFVDAHPAAQVEEAPVEVLARPYRPYPAALPRFWSPVVESADTETRWGAATAGADPLLQHAWGLVAVGGAASDRVSVRGFYQYDRFYPTFLVTAEDTTDAFDTGRQLTRRATLNATVPVFRRMRQIHSLSFGYRREQKLPLETPNAYPTNYGGVELAWGFSNAEQFALSPSPVHGWRSRTAWLVERPALGSDLRLSKLTTDIRGYHRVFGARDAFALRAAGGLTFGEPRFRNSFALGGFPDSGGFDIGRANYGLLRGYEEDEFRGRKFVSVSAEYRFPLAFPQRGLFSAPVFLRNLHGSVFLDAGNTWTAEFATADVHTAVGASLAVSTVLGHALPITGSVTLAQGLSADRDPRVYFRLGLAF
jgi:hypothetical protein